MMVTFVSQCQKNALKKTRRVLDAFADRIGDNTWQTVITNEGLQAVKKLLRKTASKNTAVSCHRFRSRSSSEFMWVVGKKDAFDSQGRVPVNITHVNRTVRDDISDWQYLPLIQAITALAALLHDWGKANSQFQSKLKSDSGKPLGDALRHEFVSCLLLRSFIQSVDSESSDHWLNVLANGDLADMQKLKENEHPKPLTELSYPAQLVCWLILSHHRLPYAQKYTGSAAPQFHTLLNEMDRDWGYYNENAHATLSACLNFDFGTLAHSQPWLKQVKRWAKKLISFLPQLKQIQESGTTRLLLHHCRLSLMLADHCYSSLNVTGKWHGQTDLIANTRSTKASNKRGFNKTNEPNQYLDQHLLGVCDFANKNTRLLPKIEKRALVSKDTAKLKKRSPKDYQWQDKAVEQIKTWQKQESDYQKQGFFAVNMASTGCGKTFANAKVMHCLANDGDSLRYILALGLRTLTLQTGDEYREKIFSENSGENLAVLIGSKAFQELHQDAKTDEDLDTHNGTTGSESAQLLLSEQDEIIYDGEIPEDNFATVLTTQKDKAFFHAPVLACTIDHLMAAVTTKRGGRYILPSLRLMSSDLVIDEIDDFTGDDSIAIGWLIHLAGMLGRKVMISSATITPSIAEGYFKAYQSGWQQFALMRNKSKKIGCAWVDEFKTNVESIYAPEQKAHLQKYNESHFKFIDYRVQKLAQQVAKRKAKIIEISHLLNLELTEKRFGYHQAILNSAIELHQQHCLTTVGINVSFGVVRCANINPALALTRFLMQCEVDDDYELRVMPYHSQQVLLLRNAQEKHLDKVLKRKEKDGELPQALDAPQIKQHIDAAKKARKKHLLFILVATPVEEVGRDHDFDWAIIEPSSYRSLVQMAGRVRRHRKTATNAANIGILQYNWKALEANDKQGRCYFQKPGYETGKEITVGRNTMEAKFANMHDLTRLVDSKSIEDKFNASERIQSKNCQSGLAQLEHAVIQSDLIADDSKKPHTLHAYLSQHWYVSSYCQHKVQFRKSEPTTQLHLVINEDEQVFFNQRDSEGKPERDDVYGELVNVEASHNIERIELSEVEKNRLWLHRDYLSLVQEQAEKRQISLYIASLRYGELSLRDDDKSWLYNDQLGLFKAV